jgi:hypothetical protein
MDARNHQRRRLLPLKGVVEAIVAALNPALRLEVLDTRQPLLDPARSAELQLEDGGSASWANWPPRV